MVSVATRPVVATKVMIQAEGEHRQIAIHPRAPSSQAIMGDRDAIGCDLAHTATQKPLRENPANYMRAIRRPDRDIIAGWRPQPIRVNQRNRLASEVGSSKPVTSNLSTRHHRPEITVPIAFQPSL
jgi:hypothetical protein